MAGRGHPPSAWMLSRSCLSFPTRSMPGSAVAVPAASPAPCPGWGCRSRSPSSQHPLLLPCPGWGCRSLSLLAAPRAAPPAPAVPLSGGGAAWRGENFPAERRRPAASPLSPGVGHLETSRERQKERISVFLTATCNRFFRAKHLCIQKGLSQAISLSRGETDGELILAGRALPRCLLSLSLFGERSRV